MRTPCVLVVYLVVYLVAMTVPAAVTLTAAPRRDWLRGLDPWAIESLDRALARSALVRQLVASLSGGDLIVHIETSPFMPVAIGGTTRLGHVTPEYRYVRVTLDRDLTPDERAATLAHELQHVRELDESGARSRDDVLRLYERIGQRVYGPTLAFETLAARRAGARAWAEIRRYAATSTEQR